MTIGESLHRAVGRLTTVSDAPELDAERLLLHVLRRDEASWLHAHSDSPLIEEQNVLFDQLIERRMTGEPLAYILGEWEFYGRRYYVTPDVLIPRPSTEALVEETLRYLAGTPILRNMGVNNGPFVIADIGTGSGCIAVTLACELANFRLPSASRRINFRILATDISAEALAVAKRNAERHGVLDQIEFAQGDLLAPLAGRQIDLIVSNPPYVPSGELAQAERRPETRGLVFEPRIALDGGRDGSKFLLVLRQSGIPSILEATEGIVEKNMGVSFTVA